MYNYKYLLKKTINNYSDILQVIHEYNTYKLRFK